MKNPVLRYYTPMYDWLDEEKGIRVRTPTFIYEDTEVGNNFTTGHFVLIREHCKIGDDVSVGTHTEIGPGVVIGNRVRIHSNCFIPELTVIEDGAWIGPCVCICNDKYPGPSCKGEKKREGVTICNGATIGANATILPGVTIGPGAIVGAGSAVVDDVADGTTVAGSPAREI